MKHGDFTQLAENYALYRPGYSPFVRDVFLAMGDVMLREKQKVCRYRCRHGNLVAPAC